MAGACCSSQLGSVALRASSSNRARSPGSTTRAPRIVATSSIFGTRFPLSHVEMFCGGKSVSRASSRTPRPRSCLTLFRPKPRARALGVAIGGDMGHSLLGTRGPRSGDAVPAVAKVRQNARTSSESRLATQRFGNVARYDTGLPRQVPTTVASTGA